MTLQVIFYLFRNTTNLGQLYSTSGVPFWRSQSLMWPDFPCPWSQALALCRLSPHFLSYISLCSLTLTNNTDNFSEMCMWPLKFTYFCLFLYHWSYTILKGLLIPPMALSSCHDRGSNLLPPDKRFCTLTTQLPIICWWIIDLNITLYSDQCDEYTWNWSYNMINQSKFAIVAVVI